MWSAVSAAGDALELLPLPLGKSPAKLRGEAAPRGAGEGRTINRVRTLPVGDVLGLVDWNAACPTGFIPDIIARINPLEIRQ